MKGGRSSSLATGARPAGWYVTALCYLVDTRNDSLGHGSLRWLCRQPWATVLGFLGMATFRVRGARCRGEYRRLRLFGKGL